jgi:lipid-A-disaccharide synthase
VDSPDFSFRVAKAVRQYDVRPRMVHYVAPTVWAWRPERAAKVAGLYDGILCLLPFEPDYFAREGMRAAFVGHAMMESDMAHADGAAFRARHGIPADAPVLGMLFGSRMGELNRMGPVLRAAVLPLLKEDHGIHIVAPTLPHLRREVQNYLFKQPCKFHITADVAEKTQAFRAMDFAVATSGTVGLELAVAGVPHIIGYKVNALTAALVRRKLRIKYAHLANILLDDGVVPEYLQEKCVAEDMTPVLRMLKHDGLPVQRQRQAFEKVRMMIGGPGGEAPSARAARFVMEVCGEMNAPKVLSAE